ncbi:MAG: non-homologous end-joining DNA ligase [Gemmatimonadota bacterium]
MTKRKKPIEIPARAETATVRVGRKNVRLTSLSKVFFPELGITKRGLLSYYAEIADVLVPHLADRAMVMKRYPNGIGSKYFFAKRTPAGSPAWLRKCHIEHASGNVIDFPVVEDRATLLWLINLGCVDLNPWYSRCDDVDRPDVLNFDLDPVAPAGFGQVREAALLVREALERIGARSYVKTSGSKGMHVYVPIARGPKQKRVWRFAKRLAKELEASAPELITAEYRIAKRPPSRVLVDYNQNAWGSTLASIYSVRPRRGATVSTPVEWAEVENEVATEAFTIETVPERIRERGDLWRKVLWQRGRFDLEVHL